MTRNQEHRWLLALLLLQVAATTLLAGCATTAGQRDSLGKANACCKSFSEFKFEPLGLGESPKINITGKSLAYEFDSGKSYFVAYRLLQKPTLLRFRVSALGMTSVTEDTFCPTVKFLDDAHVAIGTKDVPIRWVPPGWTTNGHFVGATQIPPNSAYVIIYTTKAFQEASVPITTYDYGFVYGAGKTTVYVPGSGAGVGVMPCAPTGDLILTVE